MHWVKETDIKRYRDDLQILPTSNTTDIYRYSNTTLKHDSLKSSPLLLKKVALWTGHECRANNSTTANTANEANENLTDRIDKFMDLISQKNTYRVPLKLLTNIDLVNHPIKLDT